MPEAGAQLVVGHREPHAAQSPHPYAPGSPPGQLAWSNSITHAGAVGMWVHFAAFDLAPDDWVIVKEGGGSVIETLTGQGRQDLGAFWSARGSGETIVVELWSQTAAPGQGLVIDEYAWAFTPVTTESICGANDLEDVICAAATEPELVDAAQAVARLTVFTDAGDVQFCTGFRVACTCRVFTTFSCIGSASEASSAQYEFLAESPACRRPPTGCIGEAPPGSILTGAALLHRHPIFDATLVDGVCFPDGYNPGLKLSEAPASVGQRIAIPQHAGGCYKQLGVVDSSVPSGACEIAETSAGTPSRCRGSGVRLAYSCDTDPASSGAPVLDYGSLVTIGLHSCHERENAGDCGGTASPIPLFVRVFDPYLPPRPAEVTGLLVTKQFNGVDDDLLLTWDPATAANDYGAYVGYLYQPDTGLHPPGSYGHRVDAASIPPDGACSTLGATSTTLRGRGSWLTDLDDLYFLVVGRNCVGLEGPYGSAPILGPRNPSQPIPPGSGCP